MKSRILQGANPRKETTPEEKTKEYTKKRPNNEKAESSGWWDEFDKPTKAHVIMGPHYRMK